MRRHRQSSDSCEDPWRLGPPASHRTPVIVGLIVAGLAQPEPEFRGRVVVRRRDGAVLQSEQLRSACAGWKLGHWTTWVLRRLLILVYQSCEPGAALDPAGWAGEGDDARVVIWCAWSHAPALMAAVTVVMLKVFRQYEAQVLRAGDEHAWTRRGFRHRHPALESPAMSFERSHTR